MLKYLIFMLIPLLLPAQNPRDYFPTHLGDLWQYITIDGYYKNWTIVKDSTGNEFIEFKLENLGIPGSFIDTFMIDTSERVWFIDKGSFENGKAIQFDLKANFGEWYYCGNYRNGQPFYQIVIDTTSTTKTYLFYGSFADNGDPDSMTYRGGTITLTAGLGQTQHSVGYWSESLTGAIINGVQYGTIYYDTTAIATENTPLLPQKPCIIKTYPNPFNNQVKIEYFLPRSGWLKIDIFSLSGQKVTTLINGYVPKGKKEIIWDGTFANHSPAPSGVYIIRLSIKKYSNTKRILLIR